MKKIVLSIALCATMLMGSESILGEFGTPTLEKPSMINADVGLWYISWDQTSTSAGALNNPTDAITPTYNIDSAPAVVLALNFNYDYLIANAEYYNSDGANGLNLDLTLLKLIPFLNLEFRYVKADFEGNYADSLGAELEFKSPLEIIDVIAYPFNEYLGIGYRSYSYELPQDFYLVDKSNNLVGGVKGWSDMEYSGNFFTVVLDNKKQVSSRTNYNGLVYSVILGMGKLTPKSLDYDYSAYLADSDAKFYDVQIGYSYKNKSNDGFGYGIGAGYRYNKIETSANKADGDYSLVTEFDTEFHGPFVDITLSF